MRSFSRSFSSRAFCAMALTASNSSRCTTSRSRKTRSAWARTTPSISLRTPSAAPAVSVISLPSSSKNRPVVCVMARPFRSDYGMPRRPMPGSGRSAAGQSGEAGQGSARSQSPWPTMDILVIPYPVIDPVALEIGPVSIRWYGLAYTAGILCGWLYGRYLISRDWLWGGKSPMTVAQGDDFLLWITLGIVVGGRLGFVLFYEPSFFWNNPSEIPAVWNGGMSFHGGLLGVVLAVYFFSRVKRINPLSLGDVASAATPFGLFFGRLANFINAEVIGRVTDVPWAMVFPGAGDLPRHPSQLYEAFLE